MAPDSSNWLSFSLSSMEMLNNSSAAAVDDDHHHSHQFYPFADSFYGDNGWQNQKPEAMYAQADHQASYMQPPPKLEDFFGGGSASGETQDHSSLSHMYDHHHYYVNNDHQADADKTFAPGFQTAFSANSGSEVDDSAFVGQSPTGSGGGELVARSQWAVAASASTNALSLGVVSNTNLGAENNNSCAAVAAAVEPEGCKKIADTFGQRTSIYRGVTRHRWTGRYEAHLWDNSCRREGQARKGRQVYLGGYDKEEKAARAYDLAALKYWGPTATTNFPISNYAKELEEMKHATRQEFIASLRRKSSGFSRGASIYRGVTRHHQQGRWQARIGRVAGNKDLYLGTFATEEEAAEAYDIAAIKFRGVNAVTNFEMSRYNVEAIANSPLPIGGSAKRSKLALEPEDKSNNISFSAIPPATSIPFGVPLDAAAPFYHHHNFMHHLHSVNLDASGPVPSMNPVNLTPSQPELFIWPHQSY